MCQSVGSPIEFLVRQRLPLKLDGYCIWRTFHLLFKQLVNALVPRIIPRCPVPFHEHLLTFRFGQRAGWYGRWHDGSADHVRVRKRGIIYSGETTFAFLGEAGRWPAETQVRPGGIASEG